MSPKSPIYIDLRSGRLHFVKKVKTAVLPQQRAITDIYEL